MLGWAELAGGQALAYPASLFTVVGVCGLYIDASAQPPAVGGLRVNASIHHRVVRQAAQRRRALGQRQGLDRPHELVGVRSEGGVVVPAGRDDLPDARRRLAHRRPLAVREGVEVLAQEETDGEAEGVRRMVERERGLVSGGCLGGGGGSGARQVRG